MRVVTHVDVFHGALLADSIQQGFGPFAGRDDTLTICLIRVVSQPGSGIHAPFRSRAELVSGVVSHGSSLSLLLRS